MNRSLIIIFLAFIVSSFMWGSMIYQESFSWTEESYVADVISDLGVEPSHYVRELSDDVVSKGRDLVLRGWTTDSSGKKTRSISRFYQCTSCHNIAREDRDLKVIDPEERLKYAVENKIPYLQGSTFWGISNRESWYNDDYVIKYGSLVDKAKNSLEESIQLCAQVCSQGRELEDWEMEAILAYFKSISMKIKDIDFSVEQWDLIVNGRLSNQEKIMIIKSRYLSNSPATFADPPKDKSKGYGLKGNVDNGEILYRISCQHCHRVEGESDVILDKSRKTFKWLKKHIPDDSSLSLYEIIRHGTYSELGHKEYMPLYTKEKMSDQQIEDLRAYIEKMARR